MQTAFFPINWSHRLFYWRSIDHKRQCIEKYFFHLCQNYNVVHSFHLTGKAQSGTAVYIKKELRYVPNISYASTQFQDFFSVTIVEAGITWDIVEAADWITLRDANALSRVPKSTVYAHIATFKAKTIIHCIAKSPSKPYYDVFTSKNLNSKRISFTILYFNYCMKNWTILAAD